MKVKHGDMIKLAENGEFNVIVHWCNCECIFLIGQSSVTPGIAIDG